jgi:hypothetical protein
VTKRVSLCVVLLALLATFSASLPTSATAGTALAAGSPPGSFKVVSHRALMKRGMNAALAIYKHYAYIGSRTDGTHPNAGVFVFNVKHPAHPRRTDVIGMPNEANDGETSRELRVWPEQKLLIVLNLASNCSTEIHECAPTSMTKPDVYRFYDISGKNAAHPKFISEYKPKVDPHEFYLWDDPDTPGRALLFQSTPGGAPKTQLLVTDISKARAGKFKELGTWSTVIPDEQADKRLHSLSVSNNGKRAYLAFLGGGFFIVDTSDFAAGKPHPKVELVTPIPNRVHWGNPGAHSAIKLPKRHYVLTTDEVYGKFGGVLAEHGCPWGWVRLVNIKRPKHPKVVSDYRIEQNHKSYCDSVPEDQENFSSYSSHNPTLTQHLAFVTWHSGGLQAISLDDPLHPKQAAVFVPKPLPAVVTEDPALSSGRDKVVMWSYPIIRDGLIYVVDVRNGFYVLRYKGPHAKEVAAMKFLEGNSNLGDSRRIAP